VQLTGEQRFRLGQLVRAGAAHMPAADGRELEALFSRLAADNRHLRDRVRRLNQLATELRAAAEPPAPEEPPIPCVRIVA
jgi:hypothetical protein